MIANYFTNEKDISFILSIYSHNSRTAHNPFEEWQKHDVYEVDSAINNLVRHGSDMQMQKIYQSVVNKLNLYGPNASDLLTLSIKIDIRIR